MSSDFELDEKEPKKRPAKLDDIHKQNTEIINLLTEIRNALGWFNIQVEKELKETGRL